MKEQVKEIAKVLCEKYDTEHCKVCDHHGRCMVRLDAEWIYEAGYRKQSEVEWETFSLITSTYFGKQYYFLNKDGSVYSRLSHSNMSRDDAFDEFLNIFRGE